MPGMYSSGEYDLAGFAVGAVERSSMLPKKDLITPGDVIIGLASSGKIVCYQEFNISTSNKSCAHLMLLSAAYTGDILKFVRTTIGLHSNGYSLARKVLDVHGLAFDSPCPFDESRNLGEVLLTPTKIYVKSVLPLMKAGNVKAFVHVTGMVLCQF